MPRAKPFTVTLWPELFWGFVIGLVVAGLFAGAGFLYWRTGEIAQRAKAELDYLKSSQVLLVEAVSKECKRRPKQRYYATGTDGWTFGCNPRK